MTALVIAAGLAAALAAIPVIVHTVYYLPPWLDTALGRWVSHLDTAGQVRADAETVAQAALDRAAAGHRAQESLHRRQSRPAAIARRRRLEVAR